MRMTVGQICIPLRLSCTTSASLFPLIVRTVWSSQRHTAEGNRNLDYIDALESIGSTQEKLLGVAAYVLA